MENLRVGDVMTTPAWTLQATDPISRAKGVFGDRQIRRLPVLEGERLVGMLSDRDLRPCASPIQSSLNVLTQECESLRTLGGIHVLEVMRPTPVSIGPYHTVLEAGRLMVEHDVRALPVVEQRRVIGIITQTDVLRALLGRGGVRSIIKSPKSPG